MAQVADEVLTRMNHHPLMRALWRPRLIKALEWIEQTIAADTERVAAKFEEWGEIFGDDVMAAALIDRVLHHCHLVNIRGNSYRMREHTDLCRNLQPEVEAAEPARRTRKSKSSH